MVSGEYIASFAINGTNIWMPIIIGNVVDAGIGGASTSTVLLGVGLLLAVGLAKGGFIYLTGVWTESSSQSVAYDLRNEFHEKLQELSFSFHDEAEAGQLLSRSYQDIERIRFLTGRAVFNIVSMVVQVIGVSVSMFILSPRLALLTFTVMPFMFAGGLAFGRRVRPLSMRIREQDSVLTARLEQNLRGARIVKAFAREGWEIDAFDRDNRTLLGMQRKEARMRSLFGPAMQLLAGVGTLLALYFGGVMVINEVLTLGILVAFMTYLTQLLMPMRRIGFMIAAVAQASASAERIFEILDRESEIQDTPDAQPIGDVAGRIEFESVSFSYARSRRILDRVSFTVEPGERLALLGGTGSGKSSIINLIPRFYDPVDGRVLIDGTDISTATIKSVRDQIGIVLQDTVLFASSIGENIAFGRPEATPEEVEQAARAARIHDFIASLPDGYDAHVGEKGVTLSGGQKQRISIARAILKNPRILILDDATSSVDTDTEQQIQEALEGLMENRTSVIIAQRLSTIRTADHVLVLEKGRIGASAHRSATETPHEQLLRTSGTYAEIFARQLRTHPVERHSGDDAGASDQAVPSPEASS